MPKFAANLSMLFQEYPVLERFEMAREAGFDAVEMLFPYDEPGQELRSALIRHDLDLILFNTPPPNYTGGVRGFAAVPEGEARFQYDFKRAIRYANLLKPKFIHVMAGPADQGRAAHSAFVENLRWASAHAPDQRLTIEPINTGDMPGYYLHDFDYALEVIEEVGAPNLGLQFDAYHAHKITGNTLIVLDKCMEHIVHVQIAGAEGRHEPTGGAIDYPALFERLDSRGYQGHVSAEYHPAKDTLSGLGWME